MPAHDRFLTVDLYESKDPAQVLQCLSAFSRVANATNPAKFPTTIGPRRAGAPSSTTNGTAGRNGANSPYKSSMMRPSAGTPSARPMSPTKTGGSATSSNADSVRTSQGPVSSWSKKGDQGTTNPAWNIHQYGYMGGASQGNQGIAFGARRQITSAGPSVPNAAEKERKRREKEAEEEKLRLQAEDAERRRLVEREAEEERERVAEEQRWEEESRRTRDQERRRLDEQKRQWEEQERKWKVEEEARVKEEALMKQTLSKPMQRSRGASDARLQGQFLSQYQAEQAGQNSGREDTPERRRVQELEKQLEEARERERQYQLEREGRSQNNSNQSTPKLPSQETEQRPPSSKDSEASWAPDEREYLRQQWQNNQPVPPARTNIGSARPLPTPTSSSNRVPNLPSRPLPEPDSPPAMPTYREQTPPKRAAESRPLPAPTDYEPVPHAQNRTDRFLANNAPPPTSRPTTHQPAEMGYTSTREQQADTDRRMASQQKTKAGGWASKSLLEREMERERERQQEWEANQQATKASARDDQQGSGAGQSWDVNQYGYTGGDNQSRGSGPGSGIGFGGRRQILGPRPPR